MKVLIVENDQKLAGLWSRHLRRRGLDVDSVRDVEGAFQAICNHAVEVLLIDLDLGEGDALTIADFASYRRPEARVIFVTATSFFSDGSIFQISPNAAGYLGSDARPEDLAALVEHHIQPEQASPTAPVTPDREVLLD